MKNNLEQFESTEAFIGYMQQTARSILDKLIPNHAEIILLDYPNNTNVGDSLIWLGTLAYLNSRGLKISYVCDTRNYSFEKLKEKIKTNTIVLMNGGGNFGTLWDEVHNFRIKAIKDLKNVPIIQLPQTIHFDNQEKVDEINQVITQHGQFSLIVRSQYCYDFAKSRFDTNVYLCPDMAFFIGAIKNADQPNIDCIAIARTDIETSGELSSVIENLKNEYALEKTDWLEAGLAERSLHRIEMHTGLIRKIIDPHNMQLIQLWNSLSTLRLKRGVALLKDAKVVIADRLHVHILSILLNKPHVIIDNNYGKLKHFHETWTYRSPSHKYATNPNNVPKLVRNLHQTLTSATTGYEVR